MIEFASSHIVNLTLWVLIGFSVIDPHQGMVYESRWTLRGAGR